MVKKNSMIMKRIKLFEEMEWDEPSYKKQNWDEIGPVKKTLNLEVTDMELIDRLSKELDFIYSKRGKQILITSYSDNYGKQLLITKENEDQEMYTLYDFVDSYEVDGKDSLEHLIKKSLENYPAAEHIKFSVQELSLLKKLSRECGADFKVPNKVSIFSKAFNTRLVIWKVSEDLYRMGYSQRVSSFQNIEELINQIKDLIG